MWRNSSLNILHTSWKLIWILFAIFYSIFHVFLLQQLLFSCCFWHILSTTDNCRLRPITSFIRGSLADTSCWLKLSRNTLPISEGWSWSCGAILPTQQNGQLRSNIHKIYLLSMEMLRMCWEQWRYLLDTGFVGSATILAEEEWK